VGSRKKKSGRSETISTCFIASVKERLAENKAVRRKLPVWGRLHIDRQLPFLCVYRHPPAGGDSGTERLVTSEAAYLIASGSSRLQAGLRELVGSIAAAMTERFGAFLIVEVWSLKGADSGEAAGPESMRPRFRLVVPARSDLGTALPSFEKHLGGIRIARQAAQVAVARSAGWSPKRFPPLLSEEDAGRLNCAVAGLEVAPIYRNPVGGEIYPAVLRQLRRGLTKALRRTFYDFVRSRTSRLPEHYHVLGRRALVKAVWEVDGRVAEVSDSFDLLLQITPTNSAAARREFERGRYQKKPLFHYRPLPVDPVLLKRRLFSAPVERIEDPALAEIFREKIDELDRRITMLGDINTRRLLQESIQVYGKVSGDLMRTAEEILRAVPPRARNGRGDGYLDADGFARLAREELDHYRRQWQELDADIQIRDDIPAGLMVSRGSLLIGAGTRLAAGRAEALLHHEVGTHVLTYYNGRAQSLRQLYSGLAGYEALQEGIAVLAEYLVGGLSRVRMRLLAGRVVAVGHLVDGASFVETFRSLREAHGFSSDGALTITMRVFRGGGLTKDAVYLKGLVQLLDYLGEGRPLEPLFIGKIALGHVPIIHELRMRGVLRDPPLRPRYLDREEAAAKLARLRRGACLRDLLGDKAARRSRSHG